MTQPQGFPEPLSARTASYAINLVLDTENQQVSAQQRLTFHNPSADTIWSLPFHMYYNAFQSNKTTFWQGTSRVPRTISNEDVENCNWGWINVTHVTDEAGNDLSSQLRYIQPDDGNPYDHSVLEVRLAEPILPYATAHFDMEWDAQIPPLVIRTGVSRDFYFMAQWFPKLGVYEPAGTRFATSGQWNCHQYHANTEYYGEFGLYEVSMDVPSNYVLGASGFLVGKEEKSDRTIYQYRAEDVIDFTWTASPGFVEVMDEWEGVQIRLLIMPEHLVNKDRFLTAAKHTLGFYADYIEKYPYSTLTIVSPPFHGMRAGAMEYPTLITSPTLYGFPKGVRTTETLVIHELTHQYFMQMLATNEQEEPWMDEGFTSYFEAKILDRYYPDGTVAIDALGVHVGSEELRRGRFLNADNISVGPLSDFGWHFRHGSYSQIVYGKSAVLLSTLEGLVGEQTMQAIIQAYFQRWKFKHPGRQDFIDVVNEVVVNRHGEAFGPDLNWFFDQGIYGTEACDYSIGGIENTKITAPLGFVDNVEECEGFPREQGEHVYQSRVIVFRLGGFRLPQEVRIVFDDGEEVIETWDGQGRSHEFAYTGTRKVVGAEIDPAGKIPLDKNLINNSYVLENQSPGILRYFTGFISWLQHSMLSASMLI